MSFYTPGVPYTFRSLDITRTLTKVITVTYDATGNFAYTKHIEPALPTDDRKIHVLAPASEIAINPATDTIQILGAVSNYWFIYFDNDVNPLESAMVTAGNGTITVSCPCSASADGATGTCKVTYTAGEGGGVLCNVSCETQTGCTKCGDPTVNKLSGPSTDPFVLVKKEQTPAVS